MTKKILPEHTLAKKMKRPSVLVEILEPRFMMSADVPGAEVLVPADDVQDLNTEGDALVESAQEHYEQIEETATPTTSETVNDSPTPDVIETVDESSETVEEATEETATVETVEENAELPSESESVDDAVSDTEEMSESTETLADSDEVTDDNVEATEEVEETAVIVEEDVTLTDDVITVEESTELLETAELEEEIRTEIVFVNDDVTDYQELIDGIDPSNEARTIEVVVLDSSLNGIEQVSEVLSNYSDLDTIHVISHGSDGAFSLGDDWLENDDLLANSDAISLWSDALGEDADILLYGCNVSIDGDGEALTATLATLTGADVASSTDKTGSTILDGDWDLEYSTGLIESTVALTEATQTTWNETLTVENLTGAWTVANPYTSTTTAATPVTVEMSFVTPAGTIVENVAVDNLTTNAFFSDAYVQGAESIYMEILWDTTPEASNTQASDDAQTVTVTFTFDTAVVNPILHIDRFGGAGGTLSNSSEWTVTTAGASLTQLSGVGHLNVTADSFYRTIGDTVAENSEADADSSLGAAAGSVQVNGTFTTLTFDITALGTEGLGGDGMELAWELVADNEAPTDITIDSESSVEQIVNTYGTSDQIDPAIAAFDDGGYIVTWVSNSIDGSNYSIYAQRYNDDGTTNGSEFLITSETSDSETNPSVATFSDGGFVVTWQDQQSGVYAWTEARVFDADGTAATADFRINLGTDGDNEGYQPAVETLNNNEFVVVWSNEVAASTYEVAGQIYDRTGATVDAQFSVGSLGSSTALFGAQTEVTQLDDGGFSVVWRTYDGVDFGTNARVMNEDGSARSLEWTLAGDNIADVAALTNGNFVVTYDNNGSLEAEIYATDGSVSTSAFVVNTISSAARYESTVTSSDDGFIVVWESDTGDGSGSAILAQRFDASGNKIDSEIVVNETIAGNQQKPEVIETASGTVVAVWQSENVDGDLTGIVARVVTTGDATIAEDATNGTRVADVIGVLDVNSGDTHTFSLTNDAGGRFTIDANSGVITVSDSSLLDYETATSHDITIRATDSGGLTYDEIVTVDITNVNDAPINNLPTAQTTNEDTTLVFDTANGNLISITDVDAGAGLLETTISVTDGVLNLSGTTGLTFVSGSDGSTTMTVQGTLSDINTALDGLSFTPDANFNGSVSFEITTHDDTSLIGSYTFDNITNLGEDSGTGASFNGTVIGGATSVNDAIRGDVLSLDGTNHIEITGLLGEPADVTLSAWVNLTGSAIDGADVISLGDNVILRYEDSDSSIRGAYYNGTTWHEINYAVLDFVADTAWHHIAYSVDDANNTHAIYLDGVEVFTEVTTTSISYTQGTNTYIGTHGNSEVTWDLIGLVDDARIYDRALTEAEIAEIMNTPLGIDTDTVAISVDEVNEAPTDIITSGILNLDTTSWEGITVPGLTLDIRTDFTIEMEINPSRVEATGYSFALVSEFNTFDTNGFYVDVGNGRVAYSQYDSTIWQGGTNNTDPTQLAQDTWQTVTVTRDAAGSVNIYIDGIQVSLATSIPNIVDSTGTLTFLQDFEGDIREIRVFDNALTGAEVATSYTTTYDGSEAGLLLLYDFEDGSGSSVSDLTPLNNDGVINTANTNWVTLQTVPENSVAGTVVGFLAASDSDAGDTFTYTIIDDSSNNFTIVGREIQVAVGATLNYESATSHDITVRVTDSGGLTYDEVFTINVVNINEAPVNIVPIKQTALEETQTNITGITISDVDVNASDIVTTELTVTNGILDVSLSGATTISAGSNSFVSLTLSGTITDINATLATLNYTGNLDVAGVNADTLTVVTDDDGNTGLGGALTDTSTVQIDITPVNDAPTLTATPHNPTFTEGNASVQLFDLFVVDTIEVGQTIDILVFTVDNVTDGADEFVSLDGSEFALLDLPSGMSATNGYEYSVSLVGTTATVSLINLGATPANIATLGSSINYRNSSENPTTSDRVFTITSMTDSGGTTDGGVDTVSPNLVSTVTVVAVNDAPVLTDGGDLDYGEEYGAAPFSGSTLTDADSADFDGGVLTFGVTSGADGGETLSLVNISGVTTSGNNVLVSGVFVGVQSGGTLGTDLTVTFNSDATVSRVESVYQALAIGAYNDDNPSIGERSLEVVITDGDGGTSNMATATVDLITVSNDDPFNNGTLPTDISVTEDVLSDIDLSSIDLADPDANGGNLSLEFATSTGGTLTATSTTGIIIGNNGTSTITINGTLDDINAYLNISSNLQYLHTTANLQGNNADTIQISVNDLGNTGDGGGTDIVLGVVNVDITPVNDETIVVDDTVTTNEDAAVTVNVLANDTDIDGANATLTSASNGTNGTTIVDIVTGEVTYTPDADFNGIDTFTYTNSEGNTGTVTVTVNAQNDAPVLNPIGNQIVNELSTLAFTVTAEDADIPTDTLTFTLDATSIAVGMTIDANTGIFSWTPAETDAGTIPNVTVTVTDSGTGKLIDTETFSIGVVQTANSNNGGPTATPIDEIVPTDEVVIIDEIDTVDEIEEQFIEVVQTQNSSSAGVTEAQIDDIIPNDEVINIEEIDTIVKVEEQFIDDLSTQNTQVLGLADGSQVFNDYESINLNILNGMLNRNGFSDDLPERYASEMASLDPITIDFTVLNTFSSANVSENFYADLDKMYKEMDENAEKEKHENDFTVEVASGISLSLTAGFVAWLFRSGSLIASLFATMPMWRDFDPVSILSDEKDEEKSRQDEEVSQDAQKIEQIFEKER